MELYEVQYKVVNPKESYVMTAEGLGAAPRRDGDAVVHFPVLRCGSEATITALMTLDSATPFLHDPDVKQPSSPQPAGERTAALYVHPVTMTAKELECLLCEEEDVLCDVCGSPEMIAHVPNAKFRGRTKKRRKPSRTGHTERQVDSVRIRVKVKEPTRQHPEGAYTAYFKMCQDKDHPLYDFARRVSERPEVQQATVAQFQIYVVPAGSARSRPPISPHKDTVPLSTVERAVLAVDIDMQGSAVGAVADAVVARVRKGDKVSPQQQGIFGSAISFYMDAGQKRILRRELDAILVGSVAEIRVAVHAAYRAAKAQASKKAAESMAKAAKAAKAKAKAKT